MLALSLVQGTSLQYFQTCRHPSFFSILKNGGFPGGTVVGSLPANAGNTGSSPGVGRSHMPRSN